MRKGGKKGRECLLSIARKWLPGERRLFCCEKIPRNSRQSLATNGPLSFKNRISCKILLELL